LKAQNVSFQLAASQGKQVQWGVTPFKPLDRLEVTACPQLKFSNWHVVKVSHSFFALHVSQLLKMASN